MRICLIGGIFGTPAAYRRAVRLSPEIVLARELVRRGHEVETRGHYGPWSYRDLDVVHVHHLSWGAAHAAARASSLPVVFTPHLQLAAGVRRVAMRYVIDRAAATIALSQPEAAWQRTLAPGASSRQHVIPNGVDRDVYRFSPPRPPEPGEPWRALFVGQLTAMKGVDRLLEALALCSGQLSVRLELAYQVAHEERALQAQARALGLSVSFRGAQRPDQLAELYQRCHFLVLPSVRGEALPTVITEALFTGRPVIASDLAGVRSQVGEFGAVVSPGVPEAIVAALIEVTERYPELVAAAEGASEHAAQRFSIPAMADAHEELYAAVIAAPRSRRWSRAALDRVVDAGVPVAARHRRQS